MQEKYNRNGVKLLAAVMAFAMVFVAGFAFISGDESTVDASTGDNIKYFSGTLDGQNDVPSGTIAYIDKDTSIVSIDSNGDGDVDKVGSIIVRDGAYLKINSDVTLTVNSTSTATSFSYNGNTISAVSGDFGGLIIEKGAYVVVDGKVVVKNDGTIYNDGSYDSTVKKVQGVNPGVYVNQNVLIEKGGNITGKTITIDGSSISNQMIVGSNGTITFKSTSTTSSTVSNQTFSIVAGGSVDIDANVVGAVMVGSFTTGSDYKIPSYVALATEKNLSVLSGYEWVTGGEEEEVGIVDLLFTVTDKKAEKIIVDGQVSSKYSYAVLDVTGAVGNDAVFVTLDNHYVPGLIADKDGNSTEIYVFGITEVSKTLDVGKGAYFATIGKSNVLISGDLIIDGSKENKANLIVAGIHTVTGMVKIGNVEGSTTVSGRAWKSANADATVNMYIYNTGSKGCFMIVDGDGEVSIADYDPATFGAGSFNQMPQGTYGVSYIDSDDIFHITNLAKALVADNEDEITINSIAKTVALMDEHKYIITTDTTFPEDITVKIHGNVVIKDGASLTISEGADVTAEVGCTGTITVEGYLYDYSISSSFVRVTIVAEVKAIDAEETYYLYTSFKNALSASSEGDSVELFGNVNVEKDIVIPTGITILTKDKYIAVYPGAKLTVDGTINVQTGGKIVLVKESASVNAKTGAIDNKNMIVASDIYSDVAGNIATTTDAVAISGIYAVGKIGNYSTGTNFILYPAVASENSKTLTSMEIKAKTTYSGDLVFEATSGAPTIEVKSEVVLGKVTLSGYKIEIDNDSNTTAGVLTATIIAKTTAGDSSVVFNKVSTNDLAIAIDTDNTGDEPVTVLKLTTGTSVLAGNINIASGEVILSGAFTVGTLVSKDRSILTVDDGAKLIVPNGQKVIVDKKTTTTDYAGLVVKGTLSIEEGDLETTYTSSVGELSGRILVEGTLFVSDVTGLDIDGIIEVTGTFAVDTNEDTQASVSIDSTGKMIVGKEPTFTGAVGVLSGVFSVDGALVVYPGSDISAALINVDSTGVSTVKKVDLVVDGKIYLTGYSNVGTTLISSFIPEKISIPGLKDITKVIVGSDASWFVDEKFTEPVSDKQIADYSVAYAKAIPATAYVQMSVGTGMSLWIDGVKYSSGDVKVFDVGEYNIEVTINPGYKGTTKIMLNGVQITNGKMVITPAMTDVATSASNAIALSVIGDLSIDAGEISSVDSDSGMGITDYLLIVLVIMVVILAVIVCVRMMRS